MEIVNPLEARRFRDVQGNVWELHDIEIGAWDIWTNINKTVAHNITTNWLTISIVSIIIYSDNGTTIRSFQTILETWASSGGTFWINDTNINLNSAVGGIFDNPNYDDAVMNRGRIKFWVMVS